MPVKTAANDTPETLKPFEFWKVLNDYDPNEIEQKTDCPFCGKEGKFVINVQTSLFKCWSCQQSGNGQSFLNAIYELSDQTATEVAELVEEKGVHLAVAKRWGLAYLAYCGYCVLPGYDITGKMQQLYRWTKVPSKSDPSQYVGRWFATPGFSQRLHANGELLHSDKQKSRKTIYICEGPWDGMSLDHALHHAGVDNEDKFQLPTAKGTKKAADAALVIAVPGCNIWNNEWNATFSGKRVVTLFDNDHARRNEKTGKLIVPPAYAGTKRVCGSLLTTSKPPKSVEYLHWGNGGFSTEYADGYDVRDLCRDSQTPLDALRFIASNVKKAPDEWTVSVKASGLSAVHCDKWDDLIRAWRKAMKWTPGLEHALSSMLATVLSTAAIGDQLWIKVIGPAACGKSTLCEALAVAKEHVVAKSTIRGFHSGFGEEGEDNSLIKVVNGKTLVLKDGDTLLQSPNLPQILSEGRDVYDGATRTHYRNKQSKDYESIRMTWILCGTASLRSIDESELGERFLDCVLMDRIDEKLEEEILLRVAHRTLQTVRIKAGTTVESFQEEDMAKAMQLTGGYIKYLKDNAEQLLAIEASEEDALYCTKLAKFVAHMRARPSSRQMESAEREFGTRLTSQLVRLMACLCGVYQQSEVVTKVLGQVRQIALDTARGVTLDILRHIYAADRATENVAGLSGLPSQTLIALTGLPEAKCMQLLRFMRQIGVLEFVASKKVPGTVGRPGSRWRIKKSFQSLYEEVSKEAGVE